jgi:hypothetical protein
VSRSSVPTLAVALAASWLVAQALSSPLLAALASTVAVAGVAGTALLRRGPSPRLAAAVLVVVAAVAALLLAALCLPHPGGRGLVIQLAFLAVLAPAAPLLYALTFDHRDRS